jgi:small-conductance mechanosensitive channel
MPPVQPAAAAPTDKSGDTGDNPEQGEPADVAKLRKEAAKYRTERNELKASADALKSAQEQQQAETASLKDILAKLSAVLNPDANTPPDPAKLAEQLTAAQAETAKVTAEYQKEIRDLTIRASLPGVLSKANAKPGLTEKVLIADGVLAKLDPSSDTFQADLESAVNAALEQNPDLKVAPVAKRSGAEIPGRSGGSDQLTREQLKGMKPEQIEKARQDGRLRTLLGG